jgi:hypothetical protein
MTMRINKHLKGRYVSLKKKKHFVFYLYLFSFIIGGALYVLCSSLYAVSDGGVSDPTHPEQVQAVNYEEPEPTPEPALEPIDGLDPEIQAYIYEVFGEVADEAIKIAKCESTFDHTRIGDTALMMYDSKHDEMIGDSIGLFQIRTGGRGWNRARANGMTADEFRTYLFDYKNNINYAKEIYDRTGWRQWTCSI